MTAWSTPITWTASVVSVAQLNQQIRDNSLYLYEHRVGGYTPTLADVANTVAETTVLSFVIPANRMADGDVIEIWQTNLEKNNKGSVGTINAKINVGAGAQISMSGGALNWPDGATEYVNNKVTVIQRRGAGVDVLVMSAANFWPHWGAAQNAGLQVVGTSTPANFTTDQTVSIKVTLSAASALFYLKPQVAIVKHFKN